MDIFKYYINIYILVCVCLCLSVIQSATVRQADQRAGLFIVSCTCNSGNTYAIYMHIPGADKVACFLACMCSMMFSMYSVS